MNIAAFFGLITGIAITTYAILDSAKNPAIFFDKHGIVLVLGGTFTVALLSFSFKKLFSAFKIVLRKLFGHERDNYHGAIKTIIELSEIYRSNPKGLMAGVPNGSHPFLKDAVDLIVNYGFSVDELDEVLTNAIKGKIKRDEDETKVFHTISRFPPAFGLLGATVGMISLLQTLGEPGAQDRVGPAMATALVATFYGLILANLVFIPLSEKLHVVAASDQLMRRIIKDGILMIVEKRHPTFIAEYLNSFLSPSLRLINSEQKGRGRAAA